MAPPTDQPRVSRFPALTNRYFRRFWFAQIISLTGTWMQNLSVPWLAYTLTGSPFLLGLVGAVQFLPMMLFSLFAGALTDRLNKRHAVIFTQLTMMTASIVLAALVFTHTATYPLLLLTALLTGLGNTLDFPARQSLISEIVGTHQVMNAVALNSSVFNAARIVGPALAGLIMGAWGIGWCFTLNALSFVPAILALLSLPSPLGKASTVETDQKLLSSVHQGLRYVKHENDLLGVLIGVALMSILGFNFSVLLPVLVKQELGLGETSYGFLMSCMGIGSLVAALSIASRSRRGPQPWILTWLPFATAALFLALTWAPWFGLIAGLMVLVGFSNVAFFTTANSFLQVRSRADYRGRVISFYSLLFGGMTPVGNLIAGTLVQWGGPRIGFLVTGILLALGMLGLRQSRVGRLEPLQG